MAMQPGRNPGRRNRNVGTKAHGHGQNNRFGIPESWHEFKRFYEKLSSFVAVKRVVGIREVAFLIEPTRPGWFHPVTVDDVCAILAHVPPADLRTVDLIVLRQPTRKQRTLSPVWGRAAFYFDVDDFNGSAIVLEAQTAEPILWPVSLSPERARELKRLEDDGHQVRRDARHYEIRTTKASLRNTVLYRTLLHEVGHHVDYARCTEEEWDGRTPSQKEDYAHRYAAETASRLQAAGVLPFRQIADRQAMSGDGLDVEWFAPGGAI